MSRVGFFLFILLIGSVFAQTTDPNTLFLKISTQIDANTTDVEGYFQQNSIIVMGDDASLGEKLIVQVAKVQNKWLNKVKEIKEQNFTNDNYKLIILVGGPTQNTTQPPVALVILTLTEVAKHNTAQDCWMVINNNVLDLSSFTNHPGGSTYVPYCGKDATIAFDTKGGTGNSHSSYANSLIAGYTIGELGKAQSNNATSTIPITGEIEDEEEDEEYEDD